MCKIKLLCLSYLIASIAVILRAHIIGKQHWVNIVEMSHADLYRLAIRLNVGGTAMCAIYLMLPNSHVHTCGHETRSWHKIWCLCLPKLGQNQGHQQSIMFDCKDTHKCPRFTVLLHLAEKICLELTLRYCFSGCCSFG